MCVTKHKIRTGRFYRKQAEHKKLWIIFFLDLCTCSLLSKISGNPLMSLSWDCSSETAHSAHFRKQKAADIPAWNIWIYTWLWVRALSGGIWWGCSSASRAPLLSWAQRPPCAAAFAPSGHRKASPSHNSSRSQDFLEAVHSPGKIKSMAGKESKHRAVSL